MENYREIVELAIGRKLESWEEIHHKDGDQHNNDISNLEIASPSEHRRLDAKVKVNWKDKLVELTKQSTGPQQDLLEALNIFFTERQQYIIYRKVANLPLSKTEREYFSRSIKKKLKAIVNPQLYRISQTLAWQLI